MDTSGKTLLFAIGVGAVATISYYAGRFIKRSIVDDQENKSVSEHEAEPKPKLDKIHSYESTESNESFDSHNDIEEDGPCQTDDEKCALEYLHTQIFDGIILHTDDDREIAKRLISILNDKFQFQFKIGLIEEVAVAQANLLSFDRLFEETRYLLVLVTESYTMDTFTRYFAESGLTKCLVDNQWRVIPLWTEDRPMSMRPAELKALKGIKCHKLCCGDTDTYAERCFSYLFSIR